MSVVDYFLNSLIKRLQKTQKTRKKIKKKKHRAAQASRKTKKTKLPKRSFLVGKCKQIKRKKRTSGRPAKRILQKPSKAKKKKAPSRKSLARPKTKPKKTKRIVKKVPKIKNGSNETCIGEVTHFFSNIQVVVLKMNSGKLLVGDQIHIVGRTTDFVQKVKSLQIESVNVKSAKKGQLVGLKAAKKAKPGDQVFKRAI